MSEQITLGELIDKLKGYKPDYPVAFDFGTAVPTSFDSWRGAYDQLELNYKLTSYDSTDEDAQKWPSVTVGELLKECEKANGATYEGWKGGDFRMDASNVIWVSNPGNASHSGLTGFIDNGIELILVTEYCEY